MATIILKSPASGSQCLVLEPKEALVYPFDIGQWDEIRIGAFLSYTSSSDTNSQWNTESLAYSTSSNPQNLFTFGIKDSSVYQPWVSGSYLGTAPVPANTTSALNSSSLGIIGTSATNSFAFGAIANKSYLISSNSNGGATISIPSATLTTGETGRYASFFGLKIRMSNVATPLQSFYGYTVTQTTGVSSDVSIEKLRSNLSNIDSLVGSTVTTAVTGYYSSGFSTGGGNLPVPSQIYIYSPFINNKLRVHSLLLEKY